MLFSNILSTMTSLLGSLENFYKLIAVILEMSTSCSPQTTWWLIKSISSIPYTLSTPIKRSSVSVTKIDLFGSSHCFDVWNHWIHRSGCSPTKYQNVTGYTITDDVRAATEALNKMRAIYLEHMYLILENGPAMREAAAVEIWIPKPIRSIFEIVINDRSYEEAAAVITDER